jgi:hypothetical protein
MMFFIISLNLLDYLKRKSICICLVILGMLDAASPLRKVYLEPSRELQVITLRLDYKYPASNKHI